MLYYEKQRCVCVCVRGEILETLRRQLLFDIMYTVYIYIIYTCLLYINIIYLYIEI